MSLWQYTCVDTMKDSRDTCFPVSQRMSAADIQQGVNLCAQLNTTHITVDCFFDYADYFTTWVQAVRATGKKVWFRPRWNAWQGNNGVPATMTPAQYLSSTQSFILSNPTLFQPGDILDACSEPDLGAYWQATYGANYTNGAPTAGTNAMNQYILDLDSQLQTTLQSIGIFGVHTNVRSVTTFWAKNITALYPNTIAQLGVLCYDSYPEGSSTDPATCANARLAELQQIVAARPGVPIVLGELGYSNAVTVTDDQQNAVLAAELAAIATVPAVVGMNYWVAQGTESSGGHTHIFAGDRGFWSLRPAALTLSSFYAEQLRGWANSDTVQATIAGVPVQMESSTLQVQDAIGQRTQCSFNVLDYSGVAQFRQGQSVAVFVPPEGNQLTYNQSSVEVDTSGFTALNSATLTRDTTTFWQGTASLKVVTPGSVANEGVAALIPASQFIPGETLTVSAWVNGTAGQTARLFVYQQTPSTVIGTATAFTFAGGWQRVTCTAVLPATLPTTYYGLRIDTGGTIAAQTFYVDGLQLEAAGVASPWSGGIGASPPNVLFGGTIASSKRSRDGALSSVIRHNLSCVDWHYLADKRVAANSYTNQTTGFIVQDMVTNYLAAEGVIVQRGANFFTAQQSDVEGADLSGFNPGTSVTISQDTTPGNAFHGVGCLKFVSSGGVNTFEQVEARVPANKFTPGAQVTISMYAKVASGTATVRFYVQADTGSVGGTGNITLTTSWQRFTRTVTLPNPITQLYFGLRMDTGSPAQAITVYMDALQFEQAGAASAWELGGLQQSVQAGPQLTSYVVNYKQVAACFDELATLAGFYWYIDPNKVLWFLARTTTAAPFSFDGTQAEDGSVFVEDTNPLYRNGQYILGIKEVTASQTETRQGDGKTRAFTLSYPVHQVPSSITVNAVAKTIGISGVDTGKDYYWNKGSNIITQDSGATILISTDTLSVTYIGEFNVVVYSEDPTAITTEATLEAAGTGKVQQAVVDTTIVSATQGYQKAAALLQKYAQAGKILEFDTHVGGLAPGQLLNVSLPAGWDMSGVQTLIESITVSCDDFWFTYHVKALQGPVNDNWVQFFNRLVSQQQVIDTTASGTQQIVALLNPVSESWTWTESVVETVTACPVFPWTFPVTFC